MTSIELQLIERLKRLPPARVADTVDFVAFMSQREEGAPAAQWLTDGLGRLDALKLPDVCEDETEAEIAATRQERRARKGWLICSSRSSSSSPA